MKKRPLVRYHGLFASPVWVTLAQAEALIRREDSLYLRMIQAGMRPSAPKIERA